MSKKIAKYSPGNIVYHIGERFQIHKILDLSYVLLKHHNRGFLRAPINELTLNPNEPKKEKNEDVNIHAVPDEKWKIANERYEIIKPIIELRLPVEEIKAIAKKNKIGIATIYRWIKKYNLTGTISSLIPSENNGGKGKSRLEEETEALVNSIIHEKYLTQQKLSTIKVYEKIKLECKNANLKAPDYDTVRRRIKNLSEYLVKSKRIDKKTTDHQYKPILGQFPGATFPLSVVQVDHTLLDVILVDEKYRQPIGRPWITLAIDVYSRMIPGYYISMDPPGSIGTGICIANSILPKDNWMTVNEVIGEWPCWGVMDRLHMDNGKEFHGNMLKKACEEYNITEIVTCF